MQKQITFVSLLLASVLFSTCSTNRLGIVQTNFDKQIATQQNLVFQFNQAVVPDSIVNKQTWDTTQYLNISPKVAGRYKWLANNQLVFSPNSSFAPSTNYEVSLNKRWNKAVDDQKKWQFHTPYLDIESTDAYWVSDGQGAGLLHLKLNFNYKVNARSVQQLLKLKVNSNSLTNYRLLTEGNSQQITFAVEETSGQRLDAQYLDIQIDKGLPCAESNFQTTATLIQKIRTPDKSLLAIIEAFTEVTDTKTQMVFKTNQAIALSELLANLNLSPEVRFQVEALDYGFIIKGDFQLGNTYQINLKKSVQGILGGRLSENYLQTLTFEGTRPNISFSSKKGIYLTNKGSKNIAVQIANVPKVELKVYKIYENNLLNFVKDYGLYEMQDNSSYGNDRAYDDYGDLIHQTIIETKTLSGTKDNKLLNVDFDNIDRRFNKGIYVVTVASTTDNYINSRRMVAISDIGLIAKKSKDEILVLANSILTAQPIPNIELRLLSQSNQVVSKATTNAQGVAVFKNIQAQYSGETHMITAYNQDDFNYLHFRQTQIDMSDFEVGGMVEKPAGQAFVYAERTLYRPGEKVNYNIILRDNQWKPQAKVPIKIKVLTPNGKELLNLKALTNEQGAFAGEFKTAQTAITGTYNIEVFSGNETYLENLNIQVEDFMPDRIKAKISLVQRNYKDLLTENIQHGDSVRTKLEVANLFGTPAIDRNYQMNFSIEKALFASKKYKDFNFKVLEKETSYTQNALTFPTNIPLALKRTEKEGKTNAQGEALNSFYVPQEYANSGMYIGKIYATIFDETGRSISRAKNFPIFTQKVFVGIKQTDSYVGANMPVAINTLALDTQENIVSTPVRMQVRRNKWQTVLESDKYGVKRYVSNKTTTIIQDQDLTLQAGVNTFSFTPDRSGDYEVRFYLPQSESFTAVNFYAYSYGTTDNNTFEVSKEGKVDITFDKASYLVGEQAKILFTTPFEGKMLVTIEKTNVMEYEVIETKQKTAAKTITLKAEHLPNVYVTATLIKPLSDGAIPLTVAHGFESIKVEKPNSRIDLSIEATEKSESKQKQTIKVRTAKPESDIEVTIAVVDEGILQIKNYPTPAPHEFFYQKRALTTQSYNLYPRLFPELNKSKSSVGGDGGDFNLRANQMVNKRVKLVSFWSGIIKTNAAGEVNYTIDIPQFSGSLRIMAVAYKDGNFGSAQKNMLIADPVVLSAGLPRFLSPKDKVEMPLVLSNTTNTAMQAQVSVQTTPNLVLESPSNATISIAAQNETKISFDIVAQNVVDSAKVRITATVNGKVYTEEIDINIRPSSSLLKQAYSGSLKTGSSVDFSVPNDWIPAYSKAQLLVSNSPIAEFAHHFSYLLNYPHGCTEQVISTTFPQLYAQELMQHFKKGTQNVEWQIRENVQEAVMVLASRQSYTGGFSYWSGSYNTDNWVSVYATHFLLEAQKAGYEVDKQTLERAISYLREILRREDNKERIYYYDERGVRRQRLVINKALPYALYVLTTAKQKDLATMNFLKENSNALALDSRYLLASCYKILGDVAQYQSLLPLNASEERSESTTGGNLQSATRDLALILNTLIETDATHPQIPNIANNLSLQVRNAESLNTQEASFVLLALGKLAKLNKGNNPTATIKANGIEIAPWQGKDVFLDKNLVGKTISIMAQGTGSLYYSWQAQGLSSTGKVKEQDRFMQVRRTFFDKEGKEIKDFNFKQNDLIVVRLSLTSLLKAPTNANDDKKNLQNSTTIPNVVLTDMLPAGFEIENPRLTNTNIIPWLGTNYSIADNEGEENPFGNTFTIDEAGGGEIDKKHLKQRASIPEYVDVRDDRINFYVKAEQTTQHYFYLVRAVSKGEFQMGVASADAMYNGEYYSYHGAGRVKISSR